MIILEWINYDKLFENILVFTSINVGLFGTFLATIFTFKEKEPMKTIIYSIRMNKGFKRFLRILVILSTVIILSSSILSSIKFEILNNSFHPIFNFFAIATFILFIIYVVMIMIFYFASIQIFMKPD